MMQAFLLSKSNIRLSAAEVLSALGTKEHELLDYLLISENNTKIKFEKRLGQCHSIYRFLFRCKINSLAGTIRDFNWEAIYRKDFCVRVHGTKQISEKEIADSIYRKLKNPEVNLTDPKTRIDFFFIKGEALCLSFIADVDKSFLERKAHLRPSLHPTSMHPGLSRTLINLTGLKNGLILDPFCGSGGLLIEASLMGFDTVGYDIDEAQIMRAKINLDFYKLKNAVLEKKDALKLKISPDAIVTDFPYGKGSKGKDLKELYKNFLKVAYNKTDIAVVMMPDFIGYKSIIRETDWKIKEKFEIYVHKSLTRIILSLRKIPYH